MIEITKQLANVQYLSMNFIEFGSIFIENEPHVEQSRGPVDFFGPKIQNSLAKGRRILALTLLISLTPSQRAFIS